MKKQTGIEIYSLCLMTNHFHMVVRTDHMEIWNVISKLMFRYARIIANMDSRGICA
ncbi:MAG: transposase [Blautia sp.]|nr:transposase [Blautia sp.]